MSLENRNAELMNAEIAAITAERDAIAKENRRLRRAFNPRRWTREMDSAWHTTIPDTVKAFEVLLDAALAAKETT